MGKPTNRQGASPGSGVADQLAEAGVAVQHAGLPMVAPSGAVLDPTEPSERVPPVRAGFVILTPVSGDGDLYVGTGLAIAADAIFAVETTALGTKNARALVHFCPIGAGPARIAPVAQNVAQVLAGIEAARAQ